MTVGTLATEQVLSAGARQGERLFERLRAHDDISNISKYTVIFGSTNLLRRHTLGYAKKEKKFGNFKQNKNLSSSMKMNSFGQVLFFSQEIKFLFENKEKKVINIHFTVTGFADISLSSPSLSPESFRSSIFFFFFINIFQLYE